MNIWSSFLLELKCLIYMREKLDSVVILVTKWNFKDLANKMKLACEKATDNLIMNIKI
jgi:hypothetical protein